jgi:hypothetical protein
MLWSMLEVFDCFLKLGSGLGSWLCEACTALRALFMSFCTELHYYSLGRHWWPWGRHPYTNVRYYNPMTKETRVFKFHNASILRKCKQECGYIAWTHVMPNGRGLVALFSEFDAYVMAESMRYGRFRLADITTKYPHDLEAIRFASNPSLIYHDMVQLTKKVRGSKGYLAVDFSKYPSFTHSWDSRYKRQSELDWLLIKEHHIVSYDAPARPFAREG